MIRLLKAGFCFLFYGLLCLFSLSADGFLQWPSVDITVHEPGQKAIIGWNGQTEVLILSTDVYANKFSWVVELIPFPALPLNPAAGNFEAFGQVEEIINRRGLTWQKGDVNMDGRINIVDALMAAQYYVGLIMLPHALIGDVDDNGITDIVDALMLAQYTAGIMPAGWSGKDYIEQVEILFAEQAGVHNLTGIKTENADALIAAAEQLIRQKVSTLDITWAELRTLASDYISRGMQYWVLDLLELGDSVKSREPVIYVFDVNYLFFPLKISSATWGDSKISLFTITGQIPDVKKITGDFRHWIGQSGFDITHDEMEAISSVLADLFTGQATLGYYQYNGALSALDFDFIVH